MRAKKLQKIKVFKFFDNNEDSKKLAADVEPVINDFINSNEVESVIDIKVNTELKNLSVYGGGNYSHRSETTVIVIYYTIIYYPAIKE